MFKAALFCRINEFNECFAKFFEIIDLVQTAESLVNFKLYTANFRLFVNSLRDVAAFEGLIDGNFFDAVFVQAVD